MKKYLYISFALLIFLFASAEKSLACSCMVTPEPLKKQIQKAFTGADAIFSGEVIEIKKSSADEYNVLVNFKVAKSWKGNVGKEVTINTAGDSAMCGYGFEVGEKYLVYANGLKDSLSTNICSRTTVFSPKGDVKYLAKLKRKKTGGN